MTCPSCSSPNSENVRFCGRCRMSFNAVSYFLVRLRDHLYWIFRRATAGFLSGAIAWLFVSALSRVVGSHSALLGFSLQGLLGGAFLGTIDGMIEESAPKTIRGALLGGFGGMLGGLLFGALHTRLSVDKIGYGLFLFWGMAGSFIGLVSALWEAKFKKILVGFLSGFIGGGLGGILGYAIYANLTQQFEPKSWVLLRLCEAFSGGIIGVTMWFIIGLAERFVVFKRRGLGDKNHKHCDRCETQNPLNSWYCGACGGVLQQSAPPSRLNLSPYTTLDRLREVFRFLSRLSATTGFVGGSLVFLFLFPIDKWLALVAVVLVGMVSYSLLVMFSAVAEGVGIFISSNSGVGAP